MTQSFIINKNSTLPNLRMRVVNNGRDNFKKCFMALQNSDVTFSMINKDTGIRKISNAKAYIVKMNDTCGDEYIIEYRWNKMDVNESGIFIGIFNISLKNDIVYSDEIFPEGNLIVPISEELEIHILDNILK